MGLPADLQGQPGPLDRYGQGPFYRLISLSEEHSGCLLCRGPTPPSSNLCRRLMTPLEDLPFGRRPVATPVLGHTSSTLWRLNAFLLPCIWSQTAVSE